MSAFGGKADIRVELFLLDTGGLDDLGPLLGFRGDEMAEISG